MKPALTFEVYKDAGGGFRWRARHSNGKIVADSGEAYKRRHGARNAVTRLVVTIGTIGINDIRIVEK